jgi:hypothetical protein
MYLFILMQIIRKNRSIYEKTLRRIPRRFLFEIRKYRKAQLIRRTVVITFTA